MNVYKVQSDVVRYASIFLSNRKDYECWPFFEGKRVIEKWKAFEGYLTKGRIGDFSYIGPGILICNEKALRKMDGLFLNEFEVLPLNIKKRNYMVLNPLSEVDCLNIDESVYTTFENSNRIMCVKKYVFRAEYIPKRFIFKVPQLMRTDVFCTDLFYDWFRTNELKGLLFEKCSSK
jgi:hypothetical protein